MIKEKRRKSGLTALEIVRINPQGKFLTIIKPKQMRNIFFTSPTNVIIKYCDSIKFYSRGVGIYYKKYSGIAIMPKGIVDLDSLSNSFHKDDFIRSINSRELGESLFRFANITEIFGSTLNILKWKIKQLI